MNVLLRKNVMLGTIERGQKEIIMRVSLETLKALKDAGDFKAGLAWSDMKTYQNLFGQDNVLAFWRSSGEYEVYYDVVEYNKKR